ncbi:DUF4331 domain-containing protein [Caenimonas sedimenti]|uniref:DUF4331 domain-containing protein n=1 Tax=Caenimonas sedimenti TaxID=2596921 RepID=A0A562ZJW9_9BURK|nr:DUF4331 domain-containing protein [Caenimonas sedimenti]TWO68890.1 DUF4331 domain-containing protein [Caenimonas sedimenti]
MRVSPLAAGMLAVATACAASFSFASSHREAPFITTSPKADGTDFYMFRSYEAGRSDYVTLIANYLPLQDGYGGPNYFKLDPNALYEIHLDNNGDAKEDLTFQFRFNNTLANAGKGVELPIGSKSVAIPLTQAGAVSRVSDPNLNVAETYSVSIVRGDRRKGTVQAVTKDGGAATFEKPVDYIGVKTLGDDAAYASYAGKHIHSVKIPGCPSGKDSGRVFVGQRQEGFAVNLGPIFDLVNATAAQVTNPQLINAFAANSIQGKNVTSLAIEVHKDCLTAGSETVIGGWTTASLRQARLLSGAPASGHQTSDKNGGAWTQVSRLGHPLVNEVVIGLRDKDKFNASKPSGDGQFLDYVTNPTLPALLGLVLANNAAGLAPTNLPRTDLATVFLTGITGVNKPATVTASEMLRLNTAIAPVAFADQNRLGVAGEVLRVGGLANLSQAKDLAGFPNGRRPKDDVVDIALVAMLGGLCVINGDNDGLKLNSIPGVAGVTSACKPSSVPLGATSAAVHDGVDQAVVPFLPGFPYLNTPNPGSR